MNHIIWRTSSDIAYPRLGLPAVDHSILVGRLRSVSEGSLAWFANYLSAVYKVRKSAVSATACHQGSTPRLNPRPHALI